jgi:TM2 domain-containing membrane protein YozV
MGFRFRRSKQILPGVRLNASKSGLGLSFGTRGARASIGPRGGRVSAGLAGTGMYYTKEKRLRAGDRTKSGGHHPDPVARPASSASPASPVLPASSRDIAGLPEPVRALLDVYTRDIEYRDPASVALRSLVLPGWGQWHMGRVERGILFLLFFWTIIGWLLAVIDAYHLAQRHNASLDRLRADLAHAGSHGAG